MRNYLYNMTLQKSINPNREVLVTNLQAAHNIGLLVDASQQNDLAVIRDYIRQFRKEGKKVSVLAYMDFGSANENIEIPFFTKKNVNWYNIPKGKQTDDFINQHFDILLGAFAGNSPALEYLIIKSRARFKVGPYLAAEKTHCFDLMVSHQANDSLSSFLTKMTDMLAKLNVNTVTT